MKHILLTLWNASAKRSMRPSPEPLDETLIGLMKSGAFARLYAKWFEAPILPRNIKLDFPMSDKLKKLIKAPSDKANA